MDDEWPGGLAIMNDGRAMNALHLTIFIATIFYSLQKL